ncbi:MAG: chemotaxis protein CheW, partial [Syntrophobacteraceae bacterium]
MTEQAAIVRQVAPKISEGDGKYLAFSLNREEYGIGILKVREIIGMLRITPIPQTPDYVRGVVN